MFDLQNILLIRILILNNNNMKRLTLPFVMLLSIAFLVSCSNDSVTVSETQQTEQNFDGSAARNAQDFDKILREMYDGYSSDPVIEIEDKSEYYYITTIKPDNNHGVYRIGFIVEGPEETVYLEHFPSIDKLIEYRFGKNGLESASYNLSGDPLYLNEGFNPNPPIGGVTTEKFWGSEYYWGSCGPRSDGGPGCIRGQYVRKFRFWRVVSDDAVRVDGVQVSESCSC